MTWKPILVEELNQLKSESWKMLLNVCCFYFGESLLGGFVP